MPIHEYSCPDCRVILNFLVRSLSSDKKPACPHCGREGLERKMSSFAVKTGRKSEDAGPAAGEGGAGGLDDMSPAQARKLERLMQKMEKNIDKMDENDPRQMGRFLREFGEASGEELGPEFREAVGRLEAGEDPEQVEARLSEMFGEEEGMDAGGFGGAGPGGYTRDKTLYDL